MKKLYLVHDTGGYHLSHSFDLNLCECGCGDYFVETPALSVGCSEGFEDVLPDLKLARYEYCEVRVKVSRTRRLAVKVSRLGPCVDLSTPSHYVPMRQAQIELFAPQVLKEGVRSLTIEEVTDGE